MHWLSVKLLMIWRLLGPGGGRVPRKVRFMAFRCPRSNCLGISDQLELGSWAAGAGPIRHQPQLQLIQLGPRANCRPQLSGTEQL